MSDMLQESLIKMTIEDDFAAHNDDKLKHIGQ